MLEKPEPIIFMASLDTVTLKRRKFGVPPEVTVKLSADIRGEDLQHIHSLQSMYMQVAFAPAQAVMPLEGAE